MSRNRAALPCADIGSQTSAVVFRESCPLLVRQLPRDAAHTNVDVVGTIAIREMIELFQKVVGILRRERRRSFYRTNRTMACLARRYASAPSPNTMSSIAIEAREASRMACGNHRLSRESLPVGRME